MKPVGHVCLCVTTSAGEVLSADPVFSGDRSEVRQRAVVRAMHLVRKALSS